LTEIRPFLDLSIKFGAFEKLTQLRKNWPTSLPIALYLHHAIASLVFSSLNPTRWLLCYFIFHRLVVSIAIAMNSIDSTWAIYSLFTWRWSALLPTRRDYRIIIIIFFSRFVNIAIVTNSIDLIMDTTTNCVYFYSLGGWRPLCDRRRILWYRILNARRHQWGHRLPFLV